MRGEDEGFVRFAPMNELPEGEKAVAALRIDHDVIFAVRHCDKGVMRHAEAPPFRVIAGAIRNEVRLVRQRVNMILQRAKRHPRPDRHAEIHHMQVVTGEIDDAIALHVRDIGFADRPFLRRLPVVKLRAAGNLMDRQRQMLRDDGKRFAHALAGKAAAERIEPCGEIVNDHPFDGGEAPPRPLRDLPACPSCRCP